jgi:hypothetical protein
VLRTRAPLDPKVSFDLHVLGMPPAFVLSQDQTLKFMYQANTRGKPDASPSKELSSLHNVTNVPLT